MDNVQKHSNYINIPQPQTLSYIQITFRSSSTELFYMLKNKIDPLLLQF
jgi:hypothetical protein